MRLLGIIIFYIVLDESKKVNKLFIPLQGEDDFSEMYCNNVESICIQ